MLADDIDDPRVCLLCIVQIGQPIGEAGAEMQQGGGRPSEHAVIAVGGTGHHALKQAQDTAHAGHLVQCGDEVHFRGARVGEADIHAPGNKRAHQAFRTVHLASHRAATLLK
jgi:hypothetical protein